MKPSNWRNASKDIRCLRTEADGSTTAVYINPDIVRNEFLFKATGLVVDDPLAEKKLNPKEEDEIQVLPPPPQPPIITTHTNEEEKKEEAPILTPNEETIQTLVEEGKIHISGKVAQEKFEKLINPSDDGTPIKKGKGGRKKGSKNKPLNI